MVHSSSLRLRSHPCRVLSALDGHFQSWKTKAFDGAVSGLLRFGLDLAGLYCRCFEMAPNFIFMISWIPENIIGDFCRACLPKPGVNWTYRVYLVLPGSLTRSWGGKVHIDLDLFGCYFDIGTMKWGMVIIYIWCIGIMCRIIGKFKVARVYALYHFVTCSFVQGIVDTPWMGKPRTLRHFCDNMWRRGCSKRAPKPNRCIKHLLKWYPHGEFETMSTKIAMFYNRSKGTLEM